MKIYFHFAVLLMIFFHDQLSNFPFALHLTGLDVCEKFFSKVDGMVGVEREYGFTDLIHAIGTCNRIVEE